MIKRLYEAITGTPWTTGRTASADFGPPPAAEYAAELATLTAAQLLRMTRAEALAEARLIRFNNQYGHTAPTRQRIPARL